MMAQQNRSLRVGMKQSMSLPHIKAAEETTSANLAEAERKIKGLQKEIKRVKKDNEEISELYNHLISEKSHEKYNQRRVHLLKSQIVQLERQVVLFNEAFSRRSDVLLDVENSLTAIANMCRELVAEKKQSKVVSVHKEDLTLIIESAESSKIKLYKNVEMSSAENLHRPLQLMNQFVNQRNSQEPPTLVDVCKGDLKHINLKHVGKLESDLSTLHGELTQLESSLSMVLSTDSHVCQEIPRVNTSLPSVVFSRLKNQINSTRDTMLDVNSSLLDLSIIIPVAPWPPLKKPYLKEITTESVIKSLPKFPKSRTKEGHDLIEALLKAMKYTNHMTKQEIKGIKDELKFHKKIYSKQLESTDVLMKSLCDGYSSFQEELKESLCCPLQDIFQSYKNLKSTAGEEDLRKFLSMFKDKEPALKEAVDSLMAHQDGKNALKEFKEDFNAKIEYIKEAHKMEWDNNLSQLDSAKHLQEKSKSSLLEKMSENNRDPNKTSENLISEALDGKSAYQQIIRQSIVSKPITQLDTSPSEVIENPVDDSMTIRSCSSTDQLHDVEAARVGTSLALSSRGNLPAEFVRKHLSPEAEEENHQKQNQREKHLAKKTSSSHTPKTAMPRLTLRKTDNSRTET